LPTSEAPDLAVAELAAAYLRHARTTYSVEEVGNIRSALSAASDLFGDSDAAAFRVRDLGLVRDAMVRRGWSRKYINKQVSRVCAAWRWGHEQGLVPENYASMKALSPLRKGRTAAREAPAVEPVPPELLAATRASLADGLRDMVDLQLYSGARPGEIVRLRRGDVVIDGEVWVARPSEHKTASMKTRAIFFGPRSQEILRRYLLRPDDAYLFSPAEIESRRRSDLTAARGTPDSHGNVVGSNRQRRPRRRPGARYTTRSYARAIARACERAFPLPPELARGRVATGPKRQRWETTAEWRARIGSRWPEVEAARRSHHWHPHQLRHNAATSARRIAGLEGAQVVLGHSHARVTEIYAQRNEALAAQVAAKIG
jgi:integrase